MAILVVRIEDDSTLLMNEFFDYNGVCYGLTRSREKNDEICINLEDFYEGTVQSECLTDVPVVFVQERDGSWYVTGWYRRAEVRKRILRPSLFLEGNIRADVRDVWLLPEDLRRSVYTARFGERYYEVVEEDDARYQPLLKVMNSSGGQNALLRYDCVDIFLQSTIRNDYSACLRECERLALALMREECADLGEIKRLEVCGRQAAVLNGREADGYYYEAMADEQLGRVRQGMKAIEKALRIEPEAADLMAVKGQLLAGMGRNEAAAQWFHKAWSESGDDDYLLLEGRAWLLDAQPDSALECFKKIEDPMILDTAGINLRDMERRWPPVSVRSFRQK